MACQLQLQQRQWLDRHDWAEASMPCSKTGGAKVAGYGCFVQTVGSIIAPAAHVLTAHLPLVTSANMQQTLLIASAMETQHRMTQCSYSVWVRADTGCPAS